MKEIWKEAKGIIEQRICWLTLLVTAVCSYGFAVCQPIVGIDDSAIGRYFEEGIGPLMGRYGYFFLNKICPVAEYNPVITDFIGVMLMAIGAVLWCVVWGKAIGRNLSPLATAVFCCVMISCPMISEVFIYYLHNGIGICYVLSAIMVYYFMEAMEKTGRERIRKLGMTLLLLWITNSFVESFTIVFLMAIVMIWVLQSVYQRKHITLKMMFVHGLNAGILLVLSIVLRTITIELITVLFSLQDKIGIMNRRSVLEALGWFQSGQGLAELVMTVKRFIAMYYVNAIAYIPVRIYVMAVTAFCIYGVYRLIRYRKGLVLLGAIAMQLIPLILMFIEGHATFYRNSQYVPIYVAFVVMFFTVLLEGQCKGKQYGRMAIGVWSVAMGILVYNQAYEMTQWFYVDYLKYEDAKNTIQLISYELEKYYDTEKPVVFVGNYSIPEKIVDKMYVEYDSETYAMIAGILDIFDPNLKNCYAMSNGYSLSSEAVYSVFTWGNIAFEGWDKETHEFFSIHGHNFLRIMEPEKCQEIQKKYQGQLPAWPDEGSIIETEEYIVVNFG